MGSTQYIIPEHIFLGFGGLIILIIVIKTLAGKKKDDTSKVPKAKPDPLNNYKNNKFYDLANGGIFETSIKIGAYFRYDKNNQKMAITYRDIGLITQKKYAVYNLSDILEFEYIEDGTSKVSGGLGRALVGGALFGGVGAIVGGVTGTKEEKKVITDMRIKFVIKGDIPTVDYLPINKFPTNSDSAVYKEHIKQIHEILGILNHAMPKEESSTAESKETAELKKFKQLLEDGLITQEEFDIKRKQILGL